MAISKRPFIYATFLLSCAGIALNVTSLATQTWVESSLAHADPGPRDHITYGLFSGTLIYYVLTTPFTYQVYITCLYSENVCVWSCTSDSEARKAELDQLFQEGTGARVCTGGTPAMLVATSRVDHTEEGKGGWRTDWRGMQRADLVKDQRFLNAALRVSTIVFLAIGLLFAVVAAVMAVVNSAMNPTEPMFATFGLYVWNGIAAGADFMVLAMWGAHFSLALSHNVAYTETITGEVTSDGLAVLGYSYWLNLGAMLTHICNLGLLGARKYLIDQDPPDTTVQIEENTDGVIFLY